MSHIHHHVHYHRHGDDHGLAILARLHVLEELIMKSTDALGDLNATDDVLASKLDALLTQFAGEPQAIADAVAKALSDAGLSDDEAAAGIEAARARSQSFVDRITAALTPSSGPDTTTGADTSTSTGNDTLAGGGGDNTVETGDGPGTVVGPAGDVTVTGGEGSDSISTTDTTVSGQGDDSVAASDGTDTIEGGQA